MFKIFILPSWAVSLLNFIVANYKVITPISLTLKSRNLLTLIFKRYPNKRSILRGTEGDVPGQKAWHSSTVSS